MPPKGRGRGRGTPGQQQEQGPPPGRTAPPPRQEPVQHAPPKAQAPPPQVAAEPQRQPTKKVRSPPMHPEELGIELKQKLAITPALPRSPGVGKLGRRIKLITNNFPIEVPSGYVYHYDVEIVSKGRVTEETAGTGLAVAASKKYRCMSTKRNREVVNEMLRLCNEVRGYHPAYDGRKNLYTRRPLDMKGKTSIKLTVAMEDEPRDPQAKGEGRRPDTFEVIIQPVKKKETGTCAISLDPLHALFEGKVSSVPQDAIMAMETVLRNGPCFRYIPVGRSFFYPPAGPEDVHPLGGGREIWFGYHQSIRLGQWSPLVNIDMTATTFYQSGGVLKYICEILNQSEQSLRKVPQLRDADIVKLTKELKNLWIEVTHLRYPRKYKILRVTRDSANKLEFPLTTVDGKTVMRKVSDYFFQQYNKKLLFPQLPCLQVGPEAKKVFLPIEVCRIKEGQHCKKKLEERQNAEMIKFTATPPKDRFNEIRNIVRGANFNQDPYVKEFGFKVVCEPLKLEGRVLEAPNVLYDKERSTKPKDGSWDMRDLKFFRGAEVKSWVLLSFADPRFCSQQQLDKFASMLGSIGRETGIAIGRPAAIETCNTRNTKVNAVLEKVKKRYEADLVVIVLPAANKSIYGEVKQAAETILGLATQCVKDSNVVKKLNPPLVSNICQKINAKMGGVNNSLKPGETPAIFRRPIIIIGADVTHPGPSQDIKPSIAAAVGSLDAYPSRYAVTCRAQTNVDPQKKAIEVILDLKSMIMDLLKAFYRNTGGKKPEKIILFRDGVSEGQFDTVRDHEVKCIREACRSLSADYEPGITFIVVQKRHHTRFMPQDMRDGCGKMRNVPPGTTIDTCVTHPMNFDFFLCSHYGLQGTSRPGHYTVIEDDNNFTADDLQKLTYYLCHTYVKCTKSISIPAPVQYAHLAAFRARQHLLSQMDESSSSSDTSSSTFHPLSQAVLDAIKVVDSLYNTMYFV